MRKWLRLMVLWATVAAICQPAWGMYITNDQGVVLDDRFENHTGAPDEDPVGWIVNEPASQFNVRCATNVGVDEEYEGDRLLIIAQENGNDARIAFAPGTDNTLHAEFMFKTYSVDSFPTSGQTAARIVFASGTSDPFDTESLFQVWFGGGTDGTGTLKGRIGVFDPCGLQWGTVWGAWTNEAWTKIEIDTWVDINDDQVIEVKSNGVRMAIFGLAAKYNPSAIGLTTVSQCNQHMWDHTDELAPPTNCDEVIGQDAGLVADLDNDCRVNLSDFGLFAADWQECMDPCDPNCGRP